MVRVERYWNDRFGLDDELRRSGVYVVPHARSSNVGRVFVFVRGPVTIVSVPQPLVAVMRERVSGLPDASLLDETRLRTLLPCPIDQVVGPLYEGYAEPEHFRSAPSQEVSVVPFSRREAVREFASAFETGASASADLTPVWREVLQRLAAASDAAEWEQSGLDRADSRLFASFVGDQVVALAHYSMWAADAASIGVLTHRAFRGRGLGRAVVSAAMADAFSRGHFVLYRTLVENRASVAVATAVGCQDYGRFMAVHLAEAGPPGT